MKIKYQNPSMDVIYEIELILYGRSYLFFEIQSATSMSSKSLSLLDYLQFIAPSDVPNSIKQEVCIL